MTYSQAYLGQGRYGEAIASTGAEPELVDPATPDVTFSERDATIIQPSARRTPTARSAGGITLFDADGDGDLDLLATGGDGAAAFPQRRGRFTDDTAARDCRARLRAAAARGAIAGDYDNDGRPDLFLVRDAGARLLHQKADATFEDATGYAAAATTGARSARVRATWITTAISIIVYRRDARSSCCGTTATARSPTSPRPRGWRSRGGGGGHRTGTDFDNRRDIDLLCCGRRTAPSLYRNMRDGTFRDAAADTRAAAHDRRDLARRRRRQQGWLHRLVLRRGSADGLFAMSDGQARFRTAPAPAGTAARCGAVRGLRQRRPARSV